MGDIGDAIVMGIIATAVFCFAAGAFAMWAIPKLWEFIKPFIHMATA